MLRGLSVCPGSQSGLPPSRYPGTWLMEALAYVASEVSTGLKYIVCVSASHREEGRGEQMWDVLGPGLAVAYISIDIYCNV